MERELEGGHRYAVVFAGLAAASFACSAAHPLLVSPHGSIGPTLLQAESPVAAVSATLVAVAVSTVVAGAVGRLVNAAVGLFVLGFGLGVLRMQMGTVEDLAFAQGSPGLLAVETLLWAAMILGATAAVLAIAGPLRDVAADERGGGAWGLKGAAAGILVLPVVWLVARSHLKGQTLAAALLGSLAAGLVGRLVAPHAQPRLLFAAPCAFGAAGHLLAVFLLRGSLSESFVADALPPLIMPMPIDYAAGSLTGVALGLGWAKGFLHHPEE